MVCSEELDELYVKSKHSVTTSVKIRRMSTAAKSRFFADMDRIVTVIDDPSTEIPGLTFSNSNTQLMEHHELQSSENLMDPILLQGINKRKNQLCLLSDYSFTTDPFA